MSRSSLDGEDPPFLGSADQEHGVDLFGEADPFPPDLGPMSREQIWHWQCFALDRLSKAGLLKHVLRKFHCGVELSTDYSGLGTAETALSFIHRALKRLGHSVDSAKRTGRPAVEAAAAGDESVHCRTMLLSHRPGPLSPQCNPICELQQFVFLQYKNQFAPAKCLFIKAC